MGVIEGPPGDLRIGMVLAVAAKVVGLQEAGEPAVPLLEGPEVVRALQLPFTRPVREVGAEVKETHR